MSSVIKDLLIAGKAGEALSSHQSVVLEVGRGVVGDRYYLLQGTFSEKLKNTPDVEVTLIEQEEIDQFNQVVKKNYAGKDFRRNIVTEGIRLNELIGKHFRVGKVTLKGIRLCEPCTHLSNTLGEEAVIKTMVHKTGLRAQVIVGGTINRGDPLEIDQ